MEVHSEVVSYFTQTLRNTMRFLEKVFCTSELRLKNLPLTRMKSCSQDSSAQVQSIVQGHVGKRQSVIA